MSDEIRIRQQTQSPTPKQETVMQQESSKKPSVLPWVILGAVVVIVLVLGVIFRHQMFGKNGKSGAMSANTSPSGYQAVFLTNGQVYFGKLNNPNENYIVLKDIYYLQVVQQPPLQGTPQNGQQQQQAQQSISLVKLGQELHGPVDEMHISRAQVLFYEDLTSEGQVVKAIQDYKAKQASPTPTPAQ